MLGLRRYIVVIFALFLAICGGCGSGGAKDTGAQAPESVGTAPPIKDCGPIQNGCEVGALALLSLYPDEIVSGGESTLYGVGFSQLKWLSLDNQTLPSENYNILNDHVIKLKFPDSSPGLHALKLVHEDGSEKAISVAVLTQLSNVHALTSIGYASNETCAVMGDGKVVCFSNESQRRIMGQGSNFSYSISGLSDVKQLSQGKDSSCALLINGKVSCWGTTEYKQTDDGLINNPHSAQIMPGLDDVREVVSGGTISCALLAEGSVKCWGIRYSSSENKYVNYSTPTAISGFVNIQHLVAYNDSICAIAQAHSVVCWGREAVPAPISGLSQITNIWLTAGGSCAKNEAGTLFCWNFAEQPSGNTRNAPVEVGNVANPVQIALVGGNWCALSSGGTVSCWDNISYGSNSDRFDGDSHFKTTDLADVISISGSADNFCVLNSSHTVSCAPTPSSIFTSSVRNPVIVADIDNADSVAVGVEYRCARLKDGTYRCWGTNYWGQLGNGKINFISQPTQITVLSNIDQLLLGSDDNTTCALDSDLEPYCWGVTRLNGAYYSLSPVPINSSVSYFAGNKQCAITSDAHVQCWGEFGAPVDVYASGEYSLVNNLANVKSVKVGRDKACAQKQDGSMWCWGHIQENNVSDSNTKYFSDPVEKPEWASVIDFSMDPNLCAILQDKSIQCSGLETAISQELSNIKNATQISGNCALLADSSVVCWGAPALHGRLLPGEDRVVLIPGLTGVKSISVRAGTACAVLQDGYVACWGSSDLYQLGAGRPDFLPVFEARYQQEH